MKIAFASGRGACSDLAGDTIQMLKTKQFLEDTFNVRIDILDDINALDKSYDILHLFNLPYSAGIKRYIERAKQLGIKIALSTIFWDFTYSKSAEILGRFGISPNNANIRLSFLLNFIYQQSPYAKSSFLNREIMRQCSEASDILLPNSTAELNKLAEFLNIERELLAGKSIIVPNAVDPSIFFKADEHKDYIKRKYNIENFVLTIGKIDPNKNQLSVVEALYDAPEIPIVFIGTALNRQSKYFKGLKRLADRRRNVYFLGEFSHAELPGIYNAACLHILPSFRDSPGLVSLEAALCGCEIVVSEERFCPSKEYFGQYAHYCNPYDKKSIKESILAAYRNKKNTKEFRDHIECNFTWRNVAQKTYEAYQSLVPQH